MNTRNPTSCPEKANHVCNFADCPCPEQKTIQEATSLIAAGTALLKLSGLLRVEGSRLVHIIRSPYKTLSEEFIQGRFLNEVKL